MNFEEIDAFLERLENAIDDDHLRAMFNEYETDYDLAVPTDPFSNEYRLNQMNLYKKLAGKNYSVSNEVTSFDVNELLKSPFPYCHQSFETVGDTLLAIGYLIKKMALPKSAAILEFGPGWGNTSIELAKTGYKVITVDIEENFVKLISERAKREGLANLTSLQGDFFSIENFSEKFDAVLFFESFHHCDNHQLLIEKIKRVLKPGGKIVFGAEPLVPDFPIPWGLRMDGQSLWAIRKNGWLELGFNRTYFSELLKRNGMVVDYFDGNDGPWSSVAIAQIAGDVTRTFSVSGGKLKTQIGEVTSQGIRGSNNDGFLLFGPYVSLSKGQYEVSFQISKSLAAKIQLLVDTTSSAGTQVHSEHKISVSNEKIDYSFDFSIEQNVDDLEVRIFCREDSSDLLLSSVSISRTA